MPFGYNPLGNFALYSGAGGGCRPMPMVQAATASKPSTSPAGTGCNSIIALFILVGLLALFIPGGFFFILGLILLLILICSCGVCGQRY